MGKGLIVSLGTSRLAWRCGTVSGSLWHQGHPGRALCEALARETPPAEVILGSVAQSGATKEFIAKCRAAWNIEPRELLAGREAYGVRNAYATPAALGIDRWAGIVAAYHGSHISTLVADCGTAITLDYVGADGRHLGGLIAPGLGLMRRSLTDGTRLALDREPGAPPELFGNTTEAAVSGGVLAAAAGMIGKVLDEACRRHGTPDQLLVTGGDARVLLPRLGSTWRHVPLLVLDGLELLAELPT